MCDGGSLKWKHFEPFPDGQIADDLDKYICKLTVDNTMTHNAWQVCEEIVSRIDDSPGPGRSDFLKTFTPPSKRTCFFLGSR